MAILVLLALLGLGFMIATRAERQQIEPQREALALETVTDTAVRLVRERLRDDLVPDPNVLRIPALNGDPNGLRDTALLDPNLALPLGGDPNDPNAEGEPYDAPSFKDRWLASTLPYSDDDPNLRWFRVSYLGPVDAVAYFFPNDPCDKPLQSELVNLKLTDPNEDPNETSVPRWSPAEGRRIIAQTMGTVPGVQDAFWTNYRDMYDVDGNGKIDLYDADGDGIPDSPISFTFPIDTPTPTDQPKRVHVAVRIVDNASKVNINTSSSRVSPWAKSAADLTFDESSADLQPRGRRVTEVIFDVVTRADIEWLNQPLTWTINRLVRNLWGFPGDTEPTDTDAMPKPYLDYYEQAVCRQLIGGPPPAVDAFPNYPLYGFRDEASLTHRFCLVPQPMANLAAPTTWTGRIDQDLYYSLCWYPLQAASFLRPVYTPAASGDLFRWRKFHFEEKDLATDPSATVGWQRLLDPKNPWVLKRPLLTVYNGQSDRRLPNRNPTNTIRGTLQTHAYSVHVGHGTQNPTDHWYRMICNETDLSNLDGWPTEPAYAFPVRIDNDSGKNFERSLSGMYDYEKVSLDYPINKYLGNDDIAERKADYVAMLAWAFYTSNAMKFETPSDPVEAWQAAANICDYRDDDIIPTVVKRGTTTIAVGLEPQPFITEVRVTIGDATASPVVNHTIEVEVVNPFVGIKLPDPSLNKFMLRVSDPNPAFVTPAAIEVPELDASAALDRDSVTFSILPTDPQPTQDTKIELYMSINGADVVFDRFLLTGGAYVNSTGGSWQNAAGSVNDYQRDEQNPWMMTIARSLLSNDATTNIGAQNTAVLTGDIAPSHWVFRNTGLTADPNDPNDTLSWTFDTPGELSRVLVWSNGSAAGPASERLAARQYAVNQASTLSSAKKESLKIAAGRLDFFRDASDVEDAAGADPRNIFGYVTALSANHDRVDNDGDGTADNVPAPGSVRSEADLLDYRQPGRININTAPLPTLYAVPFMMERYVYLYSNDKPTIDTEFRWDLAAGIVGAREHRVVSSPCGKGSAQTDPSKFDSSLNSPRRYMTLGDLGELTVAKLNTVNKKFAVDLLAQSSSGDLIAHKEGDATSWSPDFDATARTSTEVPEPNDAHDGSVGVDNDIRERDIFLARWGNILTTRSDVYTVYIALIDDDGNYLRRCQFTLDRTNCFRNPLALPMTFGRVDTNYYDDTR
ncbi:MAG: hypothetical protein JXQ73_17985 [Phycisphaerae bacterium]|nr:hypothetical protein [Phycisphaerae bacterium]